MSMGVTPFYMYACIDASLRQYSMTDMHKVNVKTRMQGKATQQQLILYMYMWAEPATRLLGRQHSDPVQSALGLS